MLAVVSEPVQQSSDGADQAADPLLAQVYEELRRLAAAQFARDAAGHTLQPTALVHEAWLRLSKVPEQAWQNRAHFFRAAAQAMRRIMLDRARQKATAKRAGGWQRLNVADLDLAAASPDERLLLIEDSLRRLEKEDPESAEVVMLKFFTGLTNKDVAQTLGVSEATIERRWAVAKVQLFDMIRAEESGRET